MVQGCGSQKRQRGRCRLRKNRRGWGDSLVRRQRRGRGGSGKRGRTPAGHIDVVWKRGIQWRGPTLFMRFGCMGGCT